jgi:hypothetical protein
MSHILWVVKHLLTVKEIYFNFKDIFCAEDIYTNEYLNEY